MSTPRATQPDGEHDIKVLNIPCLEKNMNIHNNVNKSIATYMCYTTGMPISSQDCANMHPVPIVGGTFIGVGVGVGVLLLLLLSMAVLIVVVVVVRRKTAFKQNRDGKMGDNLQYNNTVVEKQGTEMREKGLGAHYQNIDSDEGEDKSSLVDGFNLAYENVDGQAQLKKESAPPLSTTSIPDVYAVVDKSKKREAKKKETEDESTVTNKDDFYAMPVKKEGKVTDKEEGVVESGGVEEEEQYDDTVEPRYEPKADSKSGQQSEGDNKAPNANMLYTVVDKSRKKKK